MLDLETKNLRQKRGPHETCMPDTAAGRTACPLGRVPAAAALSYTNKLHTLRLRHKNCTKNCTRYTAPPRRACPTPRRHPTPAPAPSPPDAPAHRAALSHTFPPDHLPHPPQGRGRGDKLNQARPRSETGRCRAAAAPLPRRCRAATAPPIGQSVVSRGEARRRRVGQSRVVVAITHTLCEELGCQRVV